MALRNKEVTAGGWGGREVQGDEPRFLLFVDDGKGAAGALGAREGEKVRRREAKEVRKWRCKWEAPQLQIETTRRETDALLILRGGGGEGGKKREKREPNSPVSAVRGVRVGCGTTRFN